MEENKNNMEEDFNDFDEDQTMERLKKLVEEDLSVFQEAEKQIDGINHEDAKNDKAQESNKEIKEPVDENKIDENKSEIDTKQENSDISLWEQFDDKNSVVKKYIFCISKDFVPMLDSFDLDKRSAYINDAIQKKIDLENIDSQKEKQKRAFKHLILMLFLVFFLTPIILLGVHKAIMVTFDNYKYSQDNFEKLYRQRFQQDKAYLRSIQYNKLHNVKNNANN